MGGGLKAGIPLVLGSGVDLSGPMGDRMRRSLREDRDTRGARKEMMVGIVPESSLK